MTQGRREGLVHDVRMHIFGEVARTGHVPQPHDIARALQQPESDIQGAVRPLAAAKVIILASNDASIWVAPPFCAVPSVFRVRSSGVRYWGICIWDALGIPAALGADAEIDAVCGDCGEPMALTVAGGRLSRSEGVVHFGVPARRWWDNIGFT